MDIKNLKDIDVKSNFNSDSLDVIIDKAHAGNTILFIGAGFSVGGISKIESQIPLAKDLSVKICSLGGFDKDEDLAFSADFF